MPRLQDHWVNSYDLSNPILVLKTQNAFQAFSREVLGLNKESTCRSGPFMNHITGKIMDVAKPTLKRDRQSGQDRTIKKIACTDYRFTIYR